MSDPKHRADRPVDYPSQARHTADDPAECDMAPRWCGACWPNTYPEFGAAHRAGAA